MLEKVFLFLGIVGKYYKWFFNSPMKDAMPIFTEWLIPEALGLHTEVWIRAGQQMESCGFHKSLQLDLSVAEKEPQNWEVVRVEVAWRIPRSFIIDPWQLERMGPKAITNDDVDAWVEWNTDDLKGVVDLEAPEYAPSALEYTFKASLYARKRDYDAKQWGLTLQVPDILVRYQKPNAEGLALVEFPRPKIRLVSVDPARSTTSSDYLCAL